MDQYPDENEEFEMQYQDELEMLNELPLEYDEVGPSTSHQAQLQAAAKPNTVNKSGQNELQLLNGVSLEYDEFGPSTSRQAQLQAKAKSNSVNKSCQNGLQLLNGVSLEYDEFGPSTSRQAQLQANAKSNTVNKSSENAQQMLNGVPQEYNELGPSTSRQAKLNASAQSSSRHHDAEDSFNTSEISQISFGQSQSQVEFSTGPVSRRLFGTPKGVQRGCSTPIVPKKRLPPIQEVLTATKQMPPIAEAVVYDVDMANKMLQAEGIQKKRQRLERDLFGDIADLYQSESFEDPIAKKARTEEERDFAEIERILELRRKARETSKTVRKDELSRLQALHQFKMQNLSYGIPPWPFLPLQRSDGQRVYVRYHSDEYENRAIEAITTCNNYVNLLGEAKQRVWQEAGDIVLRQATTETSNAIAAPVLEVNTKTSDRLWVDKYKPRKYIDLLSDEMTNRSLLYWLKMWDKVVFGKEFRRKHAEQQLQGNKLNTFNKRTGKFESNGGWLQRKVRQTLNTDVDELGRPMQKVALLCGPPGLGKTTLAHTIARHAGYTVREINASDDRSPEAFKLALENGTQMSSVLNESGRPNCIILDEIDGAPRPSIEYLCKFVTDNIYSRAHAKNTKAQRNVLKRPIICICNDMYDPALRPLRQIAFVVNFPQIDSSRLAERLLQVAYKERLKTDYIALISLADKSGNDVRSCISTMQFFSAQKQCLTLQDVLNTNLGQKDRHQGLFEVWNAIFRIQRPRKRLQAAENGEQQAQVTMTDMSAATRVSTVLEAVHAGGDYERLMQGVYENYLQQKMRETHIICEALQWFSFSDTIQRQIMQQQNYATYGYLQFGFVAWHLLFATLAWPKITFPTRGYEHNQKCTNQKNIFQALRRGIAANVVGVGSGHTLLVDTVPLLKRIISPQLRSVAVQLLTQKEKSDLRHTIDVMTDMGITYVQIKSAEGHYVFQIEPDLEMLAGFSGYPSVTLPYFSRQLIAREVELERIRRATPEATGANTTSSLARKTTAKQQQQQQQATAKTSPKLPNHLQTLKPKQLTANAARHSAQQAAMLCKDFFGRIQQKSITEVATEEVKTDAIVKSPIWYRYKEGFNNAVRKDVYMNELL